MAFICSNGNIKEAVGACMWSFYFFRSGVDGKGLDQDGRGEVSFGERTFLLSLR